MSENKKYDIYLFAVIAMILAAIFFFLEKEYIIAALLGIVAIISGYYAEKNHPVKIVKIKPKSEA